MRTTLLSPLALGAVVFAALAEPAVLWAAEPVRLMGTQMDAVTAGAAGVLVVASATADGSNEYVATSASTTAFSTPSNIADVAVGHGTAVACCGSSGDTNVQTVYYAEGDIVIAHSTVIDIDTSLFSVSHGVIAVVAIDVPSH